MAERGTRIVQPVLRAAVKEAVEPPWNGLGRHHPLAPTRRHPRVLAGLATLLPDASRVPCGWTAMNEEGRRLRRIFARGLATSRSEADLRHRLLAAIVEVLGIPADAFNLEFGRTDVRRNHVIIETKDRGLFGGRKTSVAFRDAFDQLTGSYIPSAAREDQEPKANYVGIAIDGEHLAFVTWEGDDTSGRWRVPELVAFGDETATALAQAIRQDTRRPTTPLNLIEDFRAEERSGGGSYTRPLRPTYS